MDDYPTAKIISLWESGQLEIVETGVWEIEHKYELRDIIVKHEDKFYCIQQCRAGSYFSQYEYEEPTIYEVRQVEVISHKWLPIE